MHGLQHQSGEVADQIDEETIVDRIFEAVIEQRLPPGTKLSEAALCEAFGVGRMRVRRALLLLASREIVDLQSNRGAYVSSPTSNQALEVFEARCAIEPNVARIAAARATKSDIAELSNHLKLEAEAHHAGNRRQAIRLSGQFHVKLAQIARNNVMERMVKELVTRTSLIIGMFGAPGTSNCHDDEHQQILAALERHDEEDSALQMVKHLKHIEGQVDLKKKRKTGVNLFEVLHEEQD